MNIQTFYIWAMGAIIPLFVVWAIFINVSHKWKQSPIRPFLLGIAVLLVGFFWQIYINGKNTDMKTLVDTISTCKTGPCTIPAGSQTTAVNSLPFWKDNIQAYEMQSKFIELFLIPFAVSILATALFVKADLATSRRERGYMQRQKPHDKRDRELQKSEELLGQRLAMGERGQAIIDEYERIRNQRMVLTLDRIDLQDEYRDLFN